MEPLALTGTMRIVGSIFLGMLFGFAIYKAGFHDRKSLFSQFTLKDNQWLKIIFFSLFVGVILFYLCQQNLELVNIHIRPGYFWATMVGAFVTAVGVLICGHIPATALTAFGSGRFYMIWILLGMMLAIPATSSIADFLSDTIYTWGTPFDFEDRLDAYFSSRTQVVLWLACLSLIATLLIEVLLKQKKED